MFGRESRRKEREREETGRAVVGSHYVYRLKRYKVMARNLSKADAQLITRALNKLAEEEADLKSAIAYKLKRGDMW